MCGGCEEEWKEASTLGVAKEQPASVTEVVEASGVADGGGG